MARALMGPGPFVGRSSITLTHTAFDRTPLYECSARRRDLCLKTQITHKRQSSNALSGIRIRSPSKRAAADPRLRPRGHWGPPACYVHLCTVVSRLIYLLFTDVG